MTDYQNPYDAEYVRTQVEAAYAKRDNYRTLMEESGWRNNPLAADGPAGQIYWSGTPTQRDLDFWMVQIIGREYPWGTLWTDAQLEQRNAFVGPSKNGWSDTDGWKWEQQILFPWLYVSSDAANGGDTATASASPTGQSIDTTTPNTTAPSASAQASAGITPQLGLLEDDILYNLALLATNVLEPLRRKYPNIIIASGFRQVNTGMSQHEKGEAADIQVRNQTPALLYEIADYIAKSLPFDQLILHYSDTPAVSWIHVSFSATSLRRQVLTRNYDDSFLNGLHLITPLTGEALAQAQRDAATILTRITKELTIEQARQNKLNPPVIIGDAAPVSGTTGGDGAEGPGGPQVWAWLDRGGPPVVGGSIESYRASFFETIGKNPGDAADDWITVMNSTGYPKNPAVGQEFTGIYQQASSGGEVRGRLFLPTAVPDDEGYYFHTIDVLASAPSQ